MISRTLFQTIRNNLFKGKAIVLTGPRQVGKTTLLKSILATSNEKVLSLTGDDPVAQRLLNRPSLAQLNQLVGDNEIVFIDEA